MLNKYKYNAKFIDFNSYTTNLQKFTLVDLLKQILLLKHEIIQH